MGVMKCILSLLAVLAISAWTKAGVVRKGSGDNNNENEGDLIVTGQLEKANNSLNGINLNGGRCVQHGSLWPKAIDGKVYVPYVIANHYSSQELDIIKRGINSFTYSTCIRFFPRTNQRDYLYIQSLDGCYSCVGRQGSGQTVSLSREGCINLGKVQHELLHVLGFDHEHCRSDRDQHIQVLLQNILKGHDYNFNKVNTLNQGTPYDYSSVMHYDRLAFSKDNYSPTMVAVPDPNIVFGMGRKMSQNDINRVNLLYCQN